MNGTPARWAGMAMVLSDDVAVIRPEAAGVERELGRGGMCAECAAELQRRVREAVS